MPDDDGPHLVGGGAGESPVEGLELVGVVVAWLADAGEEGVHALLGNQVKGAEQQLGGRVEQEV